MGGLFLVRHGETLANAQGRYMGKTDASLTDRGLRQEEVVLRELRKYSLKMVLASDLPRAHGLGVRIAADHGIELEISAALREMDFGLLEGLTYEEAMSRFPDEVSRWYGDALQVGAPCGESGSEVLSRVEGRLRECLLHDGDTQTWIAVVSHGGPLRLWLAKQYLHDPARHFELPISHGCIVACHANGFDYVLR